ncbi:unnamed protein product [Diatraea saccharalis]|uniref:Uncharacterized protein n=1 Tax=Diatraea saccharalis TaxID=40085 RepID=A0A9N9RBS4_9NEOP|nr:unnamed protein product [Diatraea saccharalis]
MNGRRSDASTSTEDDLRARPLCLFYFTHPFGVLSPEPPTLAAAPAHIARAFVNMEPVSPMHFWASSTTDSYDTAPTSSSKLSFDLGNTKVHKNPVNLVSVTNTRKCTIELGARTSLSSSLLSSDMWFSSSSGSRGPVAARRVVPYHRILPPLHLPVPQDSSPSYSSDDVWPKKYLNPAKFSLPPIEMPVQPKRIKCKKVNKQSDEISSVDNVSVREVRSRRRMGISKHKRRRRTAQLSDVRRLVTRLITRAVKGMLDL